MREQPPPIYDRFIARLDEQLQVTKNCTVWRKPQLSLEREPALLVTRIGFTILRIPVHLLVDYVSEPTPGDFISLFEEGMDYSKKAFSGGTGLKILSSSFAMVPCIACEDVHPDTIRYVTRRHLLWSYHLKFWWHGFDFFPVLFSLKTREIHYWRGNSLAGGAVYPLSRRLVEETIGAATGF